MGMQQPTNLRHLKTGFVNSANARISHCENEQTRKVRGLRKKLRFFKNFTPIYERQLSQKGKETLVMFQYGDAGFQLTVRMWTKFHCHLSMIRRQHMQTRVLHQYGLHNQEVALIKGNLLFSCASDQKVTKLLNLQFF